MTTEQAKKQAELDAVPALTVKEAIDIVRRVFVTEGKERCADDSGRCRYWTEDKPHGCAVGCLMTLEQRQRAAEIGAGSVALVLDWRHIIKIAPQLRELPQQFLSELQGWHDYRASSPERLDEMEEKWLEQPDSRRKRKGAAR